MSWRRISVADPVVAAIRQHSDLCGPVAATIGGGCEPSLGREQHSLDSNAGRRLQDLQLRNSATFNAFVSAARPKTS